MKDILGYKKKLVSVKWCECAAKRRIDPCLVRKMILQQMVPEL